MPLPAVVLDAQAYDITYRLAEVYWMGSIATCFFAACMLVPTTLVLMRAYPKLPQILQTQWTIIVPQWWVAVNYFCLDLWNLTRAEGGRLRSGPWCSLIAFTSIFWAISGRVYWALTAYATYRNACGQPVPSRVMHAANVSVWVLGLALASTFSGQYGPYKGLYCCVTEDTYYPYATFPCFFATFGGMVLCFYYYYQAHEAMRTNRGVTWSARVLSTGGFSMALAYYAMWSGVIGIGFFTAVGGQLPAYMDALAGWAVKLQPVVHGYLLQSTIHQLQHKPKDEGP